MISPLCRSAALKLLAQRRKKAAPSEADQQDLATFRTMHLDCFNAAGASLTSGTVDVGEEVLRSVAQVVLARAQRAAWQVLQGKLLDAAGCNLVPAAGAEPRFPATCRVLGSLTIADLATSPTVLTEAAMADFFDLVMASGKGAGREARPWMKMAILDEAIEQAGTRWSQGGERGIQSGLAQMIRRHIKEQVEKEECELAGNATDKAFWVSGMCLIEAQSPVNFGKCDVDGWTSQCTDPITTARIQRLWTIIAKLHSAQGKPALSEHVELVCAAADIATDEAPSLTPGQRKEAHDYVAAMKAVLGGLAHKDWIETTSGAVRVLRRISGNTGSCTAAPDSAACREDERAETLFALLATLGNYAETFTSGGSAKDAAASREKILEDLIDRMVHRSHRDSGWVVSAGGNLGLFGGARTDFAAGAQVAFPVQLGLGVGLQSYGKGNYGFHAMATAIDLGQYVAISGSSLTLDSPAVESSVTLGLTLGAWLGLRETPWYLGAYGGVSPFVKAHDKPTYQLGLVTGIYIPLLDFN